LLDSSRHPTTFQILSQFASLGATQERSPEPASLARRLAALVYDGLVLAGILLVFTLIVVLSRGARAVDPQTWWFEASLLVLVALFYLGFWTHGGQTLGMRAWRIRVVSNDGGPVSAARATARFFAAWLAALPVGLGYWWSLWDAQGLCWHDRLSRTRVIREQTSLANPEQRDRRNQQ
jgi:uncharacterized RDD family membrane protein YckC